MGIVRRKSEKDRKDYNFIMRMTLAERDQLSRLARIEQCSVAQLVRMWLKVKSEALAKKRAAERESKKEVA